MIFWIVRFIVGWVIREILRVCVILLIYAFLEAVMRDCDDLCVDFAIYALIWRCMRDFRFRGESCRLHDECCRAKCF